MVSNEKNNVGFNVSTILFFFSKINCQTCIEEAFDLLNSRKFTKTDIYLVSTDIGTKDEIEIYYAKYKKYLGFHKLDEITFTIDENSNLPLLMIVNEKKEVIFKKSIAPVLGIRNDIEDNLFWKRFYFILDLLN